jgi:hypothetical protein
MYCAEKSRNMLEIFISGAELPATGNKCASIPSGAELSASEGASLLAVAELSASKGASSPLHGEASYGVAMT